MVDTVAVAVATVDGANGPNEYSSVSTSMNEYQYVYLVTASACCWCTVNMYCMQIETAIA